MLKSMYKKIKKIGKFLKDVLYGMTGYDIANYAILTRGKTEYLFMLFTLGDLIGVPVFPPYFCLQLLPYLLPRICGWKRVMLREKDFIDSLL